MLEAVLAPSAVFHGFGVACQPSGTPDGIGRASQAAVSHRILYSNTVFLEGPWIRSTLLTPETEPARIEIYSRSGRIINSKTPTTR
jgi:hypothetical protein